MKRKRALIISDPEFTSAAHNKQSDLQRQEFDCSIHFLGDGDLGEILKQQKVGTKIFLVTSQKDVQSIVRLALGTGFSQQDLKILEDKTSIFCSQCHLIQRNEGQEVFQCERCRCWIEPSLHYSVYHNAYLAYPVLKKGGIGS